MTHGPTIIESVQRSNRGKPPNPPEPGTLFGRWVVLERVEYRETGGRVRPYIECECDCGTVEFVNIRNLRQGNSKSCGCWHMEKASEANSTHRQSGQRLHRIWKQMRQRCYNPNARSYKWYGAKGITICDEWLASFEAFRDWSLVAGYFDAAEIDRKESSESYCPGNCQWVTKAENLINKQALLPVHLERAVRQLADEQGVPAATIIRQAVEAYVASPPLRRKRVKAG